MLTSLGFGVFKAGQFRQKIERDAAGGAVALFGDDELRFGALLEGKIFVAFVLARAVDENHEIGILLDGTGFAEVGEKRALVFAALVLPRELRQS